MEVDVEFEQRNKRGRLTLLVHYTLNSSLKRLKNAEIKSKLSYFL
jgi:hypothetical protein